MSDKLNPADKLAVVCYVMTEADFKKFQRWERKAKFGAWSFVEFTTPASLLDTDDTPTVWLIMRNAMRRAMQQAMGLMLDTLAWQQHPGKLVDKDPTGETEIIYPAKGQLQ